MIKPPKIFLYYIVIACVFVGLGFIIPREGIKIKGFPYVIKWIDLSRFLQLPQEVPAVAELSADSIFITDSLDALLIDTMHTKLYEKEDTLVSLSELTKDTIPNIEYPESFRNLLYQFYSNISSAVDSGKIVRILHMGDSQIEGDRITKFLRESFQERFQGSGPGLIPVYDPQKQFPSVWITNKGKWSEYKVYQIPRTIEGNDYGIIGKVAKIDSAGTSVLKIAKSRLAQPKASNFYKARLYLKNISTPLRVAAYWEKDLISKDSLLKESGITEINWTFEQCPKEFSIDFSSDESPVFLGLSLDSVSGISVDNISMRGQSTPRLDKTNQELFASMANYMNIGMVILQYGTNMVPTISDNYAFYTHSFYRQLKILKKTMPNVPVLIVGVGDVATQKDGKAESYSHVEKIKEAQKEAAFKAGFAFFDLYKAMGGKGSMLQWVDRDPRMAMSDYTHFNKVGGKKVADWLYNAILHDYNKWKKSTTFIQQKN